MAGGNSMLPIQRRVAPTSLSFKSSTPKTTLTDGTPCGSVRRWADYTPTAGGPLTTASRRSLGDGPATLWPPTPSPMAAQYPRLLDSNRVIPGFATSYANGPTVMSIPNATATHFTEATSASAGMMTSGALAQAPATATAATAKRQQYANAPPPLGSTPATQVVWVPMQVPMQAAPTTQGTIIQPATMPAGNASSWVAAGQLIQVSTGLPVSQDSNMQVDDEPLPPPSAQQKAQIASYAGRQLFSEALEGRS